MPDQLSNQLALCAHDGVQSEETARTAAVIRERLPNFLEAARKAAGEHHANRINRKHANTHA